MIFVVRVAQDKCMGTQSGDYRQIMTFPRQKKTKNKQTKKTHCSAGSLGCESATPVQTRFPREHTCTGDTLTAGQLQCPQVSPVTCWFLSSLLRGRAEPWEEWRLWGTTGLACALPFHFPSSGPLIVDMGVITPLPCVWCGDDKYSTQYLACSSTSLCHISPCSQTGLTWEAHPHQSVGSEVSPEHALKTPRKLKWLCLSSYPGMLMSLAWCCLGSGL